MTTKGKYTAKKPNDEDGNIIFKVAKILYTDTMTKATLALKYMDPTELQLHHTKAVYSALEIVSKTTPLTDANKKDFKCILDRLFDLYTDINDKKKNTNIPAIGIDIGTTYCCVAVFKNNGKAEIIPSESGKNKIPSYIAYPREHKKAQSKDKNTVEGGKEIVCGETAKGLAHKYVKETIYDVKRMFGRSFQDSRFKQDIRVWPFDVIDDKGEVKIKTGQDSLQTPVQVAAEMLKHLKNLASQYLGAEVSSAVVTVPTYFNTQQRRQTTEACTLAGLNVIQLVNEPTAAAVAYNFHKKINDNSPTNCLVFDFGGGTLDIAVLTISPNQIHVRAVGGDDHLGGQDIDYNLVEHCLQKFKEWHGVDVIAGLNSEDTIYARRVAENIQYLKKECERQKCLLSCCYEVKISLIAISFMHQLLDLEVRVTRPEFDAMNSKIFEKSISLLNSVLAKAQIDRKDIDEIVMAGGSSRIPRIQEMVSEHFGGKELCRSVDVDEAVAIGASMLAFYAEHVEIPNILLQEEESVPASTTHDGGNTYVFKKPGCVLIINNRFDNESRKRRNPEYFQYKREGAKKDAKDMEKLFEDVLGCSVKIKTNVASAELPGIVASFQEMYCKESDFSVVFLMSHGTENNTFLMDDLRTINLYRDLVYPFRHDRFPEFEGKPKIFLIQACDTGLDFAEDGFKLQNDSISTDISGKKPVSREIADTFIGKPCLPFKKSWRNSDSGSWYIQAVDKVFREHWHTMDLETMHAMIEEEVIATGNLMSDVYNTDAVQTPSIHKIAFRRFKFPNF